MSSFMSQEEEDLWVDFLMEGIIDDLEDFDLDEDTIECVKDDIRDIVKEDRFPF